MDGDRFSGPARRERVASAVGAVGLALAIGYALVLGLGVDVGAAVDDGVKMFAIGPPAPPPVKKVVPRRARSQRAQGAASPVNLRAKPTEVVAPVPVVPVVVPPPVIAAPIAGPGAAPSAGASDRPGPGTGAGGVGEGTGSGGSGDGDGDGGYETPPRRIRGAIRDSDYPRGAGDAGVSGTVSVRFRVGVDGRVTGCRVTASSGSPELDATTCRLIEQRFRYAPSRDEHGRPVASTVVMDNDWVMERVPGER